VNQCTRKKKTKTSKASNHYCVLRFIQQS